MLRNLGLGRWVSAALFFMVLLAVWRANDGNLAQVASSVWTVLEKGAEVVTTLWRSFVGDGSKLPAPSA